MKQPFSADTGLLKSQEAIRPIATYDCTHKYSVVLNADLLHVRSALRQTCQ